LHNCAKSGAPEWTLDGISTRFREFQTAMIQHWKMNSNGIGMDSNEFVVIVGVVQRRDHIQTFKSHGRQRERERERKEGRK